MLRDEQRATVENRFFNSFFIHSFCVFFIRFCLCGFLVSCWARCTRQQQLHERDGTISTQSIDKNKLAHTRTPDIRSGVWCDDSWFVLANARTIKCTGLLCVFAPHIHTGHAMARMTVSLFFRRFLLCFRENTILLLFIANGRSLRILKNPHSHGKSLWLLRFRWRSQDIYFQFTKWI